MNDQIKDTLTVALNALERLLKLFKIERILYLTIGIIGFLLLIYAVVILFRSDDVDTAALIAIFGSAGLITASSARITFFFNKAFRLVEDIIHTLINQK